MSERKIQNYLDGKISPNHQLLGGVNILSKNIRLCIMILLWVKFIFDLVKCEYSNCLLQNHFIILSSGGQLRAAIALKN